MIRILGQGGMGSVMLARSVKDGMPVAIKTLLPEVAVSEQSLKRFLREIEVAASLAGADRIRAGLQRVELAGDVDRAEDLVAFLKKGL